MLTPEQIPDAAVTAAWNASSMLDAIAAAINAWPGMSTGLNIYGRQDAVMHLPLPPQEKQNAK